MRRAAVCVLSSFYTMKTYEHLIIGGGIAGVTAAETIRGKKPHATIGIVSSEPHVLYSRVLLPSYLKNKIRREQVFLRKEDDFARVRIDFLRDSTVAGVDMVSRRVTLADGEELGYGTLLISAGGRVRAWPHGVTEEGIYRLQTIDDADRLYGALPAIRQPVVIGSSFIALEFIETFLLRGMVPRLLMRGPHFFESMLDNEGASLLEEHMIRQGATLMREDEVAGMERIGAMIQIQTRGGKIIEADAVAVGIGIGRNMDFLDNSGVVCGTHGVRTDEFLQTSMPGVFAAGDITEYRDIRSGQHAMAGNWTNAMLQGRQAGMNMAGERGVFSAVPAYSIVHLGLNITALGMCSNDLETISRMDQTTRQYERFFIRDGVLAGAFLINRFVDKPVLAEMIARQTVIAPYADRLRDMAFDIRTISAILEGHA